MGMLLAVPIAWFNLRRHLGNALQSESRGGTGGRAVQTLRHGFIVAQIALAFVLFAGAGLLGLSLKRAMAVSPGFRPDHVLSGQISLPWNTYPNGPARLAFTETAAGRTSRGSRALSAGVVNNVPSERQQRQERRHGERPRAPAWRIAARALLLLGWRRLLRGHGLLAARRDASSRPTIPTRASASAWWTRTSRATTGRGAALSASGCSRGRTSDRRRGLHRSRRRGRVKQAGLTDDAAQGAIYYPYAFRGDNDLFVVVRTSLPPESLGLTLQARGPADRLRPARERSSVDGDTHRRQPGRPPLAGAAGGPLLRHRPAAHLPSAPTEC